MRAPGRALLCLALVLAMLASGCSFTRRYSSSSSSSSRTGRDSRPTGYRETGKASYYGREAHGQPTASGEKFNMNALTAAHKTLPFDTRVRVTNLSNDKSVTVRINDRGPFVAGRVIDLSYAAAKKIGMLDAGVVSVELVVVK